LVKEGAPHAAIIILKQWSKWYSNSPEAFGLLGNLLWDETRYYEALQVYHSAKISYPDREEVWKKRESSWGDVAFQIEEAKKLIHRLSAAPKVSFSEVLHLHAEIVAKLTHSLDHAIHFYCRTRFSLSQDHDPIMLKELFSLLLQKIKSLSKESSRYLIS